MKIKKSSNKNFKIIFIAILSLAIFGFAVTLTSDLLGYSNVFIDNTPQDEADNSTIDYNPPTDEQKQAGENIKNQNTETSTTNNDLGVSISSKTIEGNTLKLRSVINGAISSSGTCTVKLTSGNLSYTDSTPTFAMTSYSTCQGFNISTSDLGKGEWQIELSVTIDNKTSTINDSIILE